jgi:putative hydrolases of HD superfamily
MPSPHHSDLHRIVAFILEIDQLKAVTRKTKPLGLERYENSAEHSWQIALLAHSLAPYATGPIDIDRVIGMLLVHDIGEIDTGDVMVYHDEGLAERKLQERAAVTRLFALLPNGHGDTLMALWEEFEAGESAEARFAHAADRAMPVLLNLANKGQSWVENGISHARVVARVGPPICEGCPPLWAYIESQLEHAKTQGWFGA